MRIRNEYRLEPSLSKHYKNYSNKPSRKRQFSPREYSSNSYGYDSESESDTEPSYSSMNSSNLRRSRESELQKMSREMERLKKQMEKLSK